MELKWAIWGLEIMLIVLSSWVSNKHLEKSGVKHQALETGAQIMRKPYYIRSFIYVVNRWNRDGLLQRRLPSYYMQLIELFGGVRPYLLEIYVAYWMSVLVFSALGLQLLYLLTSDVVWLISQLFVMIAIPFIAKKNVVAKLNTRKQEMLLAFPHFVSRLTLLLGAGLTIQGALNRCADTTDHQSISSRTALDEQLRRMSQDLENGKPLTVVLDELNERCRIPEISVFVTTVLMNYRKGGDALTLSLKEISREMWERRKAHAKGKGEKASSQLIFPMMLIFMAILGIVASPAIMLLGE